MACCITERYAHVQFRLQEEFCKLFLSLYTCIILSNSSKIDMILRNQCSICIIFYHSSTIKKVTLSFVQHINNHFNINHLNLFWFDISIFYDPLTYHCTSV